MFVSVAVSGRLTSELLGSVCAIIFSKTAEENCLHVKMITVQLCWCHRLSHLEFKTNRLYILPHQLMSLNAKEVTPECGLYKYGWF